MAFQPAPGCIEVQIRWTFLSNVLGQSRFIVLSPDYDQTQMDAVTSIVDDWVHEELKPILSAGVTYRETYAKGLEDLIDLQSSDATNTGVGGVSGGINPNNNTVAMALRTGFTGRSARGRLYIPPTPVSQMSVANVLNSATATAWLVAMGVLDGLLLAQGAFVGVLQRVSEGVPLEFAVLRTVTEYAFTDLFMDSQRRRLPK